MSDLSDRERLQEERLGRLEREADHWAKQYERAGQELAASLDLVGQLEAVLLKVRERALCGIGLDDDRELLEELDAVLAVVGSVPRGTL